MNEPRDTYNPALDGMRALAALSVLCFHAHIPSFRGGMIGVDIFFVLSGFLITGLLRSEVQTTGKLDYRSFFLRRIARLWPAMLLMLAVMTVAYAIFRPEIDPFSSALMPAIYITDYTRALLLAPLHFGHSWSLSVEMHFYLVWPFLIFVTRNWSKQRLFLLFISLFVAATFWRIANIEWLANWSQTYFRLDTRISGLLAGAALAVLPWQPSNQTINRIAFASVGVLVLATTFFVWEATFVLTFGTTLVVLATAGVILSVSSQEKGPLVELLSLRVLTTLGKWSYGIYLWHYPIAWMIRDDANPFVTLAIVLPLSVLAAALSYTYVELPIRHWAKMRGARTNQPSLGQESRTPS